MAVSFAILNPPHTRGHTESMRHAPHSTLAQCNPVFVSYAIVRKDATASLYVDASKVGANAPSTHGSARLRG
eukprot:352130-Chlamydomonas_euryale.AAC.4